MKKFLMAIVLFASTLTVAPLVHAADADDLAYFKQFIFEETIDDADPENVTTSTRYLMSEWDAKTKLPNGDELGINASLLLYQDFTFDLVYQESLFKAGSPGFFPGACKAIKGTWSVQGGRLVVPGFGYLERALWHGQNAASLTITDVVISDAAKDFKTTMNFGFSNMPREQAAKCFGF
ncbi:hypothetical protein [Bdellovibrio sp. HCB337]|uniref:hypothetical protein n=1 Tax=Bdellovibrio sp. HCB337 TaxID=3394358 RepID=UPI0039A5A1FF